MSILICNATGNLTGAATFAAAETGALSNVLNRNTLESLANNASVTSATFTVTNAKVIDAVLLWVRQGAAGSTGTFKVDLQKGGVSQASVTVNRADLPSFVTSQAIGTMVPVLFKLGSTATGDGGSNWTIVLTNNNGTNGVNYAGATASTTNFTRALRTTTAATPAAADDLYVIGELTGAGTHNALTVTMNSTAATAYGSGSVNSATVAGGGIHIGYYGTLTYGTSASTNYILRINGDLCVYEQGPLNIGASGSEIPRNSTAVLEFQITGSSGDFGLRCLENSTVNVAGLSRTSGKNVTQCKLTADVSSSTVLNAFGTTNGTSTANAGLEATGLSPFGRTFADTVTNATHGDAWSGPSVTNTSQTATFWIARGTGTNNRFVRVTMGNSGVQSSVTNGFFSDLDLQAGTAGTVTAVGNGTATSVSITPVGSGYVVRMTGKVSSGAATPSLLINACSAAATLSFAGAGNQCFVYDHVSIVTTASMSDTTFNVDTDTGWLSGDAVVIPGTYRGNGTVSNADCEIYPLNANAGASSFTSALYPFREGVNNLGIHSGNASTPSEIGLLSHNVKIRSTSTTLFTYIYMTASAIVTMSWAQMYYFGANIANKQGINIDAAASGTAGAKSITFCSLHDVGSGGLILNAGNSINLTFTDNVLWNIGGAQSHINIGIMTVNDWTISRNLIVLTGATNIIQMGDVGGACNNNTVTGGVATCVAFNMTEQALIGSFDGNCVHSTGGYGIRMPVPPFGVISNFKAYRNNVVGIQLENTPIDLSINDVTLFGNVTNFNYASFGLVKIGGASNRICGDTTYGVASAIVLAVSSIITEISNLDTTATGIFVAPTTQDFNFNAGSLIFTRAVISNCKFGAPSLYSASAKATVWTPNSYFKFEKYQQTAGDHRFDGKYGVLQTDSTIFNTATPSMRMTPNNASIKLASSPAGQGWVKQVASGATVSVSYNVRKSAAGDGAAYNGNQPRLIQRANAALGQPADVVLATYSAGTGSWNQLSGTSSVATDDGAFEFMIDCDGTAGWINVDDPA